jgi:hypothetical protein
MAEKASFSVRTTLECSQFSTVAEGATLSFAIMETVDAFQTASQFVLYLRKVISVNIILILQ